MRLRAAYIGVFVSLLSLVSAVNLVERDPSPVAQPHSTVTLGANGASVSQQISQIFQGENSFQLLEYAGVSPSAQFPDLQNEWSFYLYDDNQGKNSSGFCRADLPSDETSPIVPLNTPQPCDPNVFQWTVLGWNATNNFKIRVTHA